jgi:hypothetical protein
VGSGDFVDASLYQLQAAARLPCSGISEIAMNAALAMIEAAAPRDEMEAALAIQMACTHAATMSVLARFGGGHGSERRVAALGAAAARLLRAYSTQVEAFRRLRHGGQQLVRVDVAPATSACPRPGRLALCQSRVARLPLSLSTSWK